MDWADAVLKDPLEVKDGLVHVPDAPGTGIAWDEKAVKKYSL
jgi:mandelate racemase